MASARPIAIVTGEIRSVSARPVAIVTGAARGIGLSISERLLQLSYRVVLLDVKEKEGEEATRELQTKYGLTHAMFVKGDVSRLLEFEAAFEMALDEFRRVDLLINNAAIIAERNPDRTLAVNLLGAIHGCELALKHMGTSSNGRGGVVINVSSISGLLPYPDTPAYVSAKHGLIGLTRSYGHHVHFKKDEVIFMAICPHYANTQILREAETLKEFNPLNVVESLLMPIRRVTDGIKKLLDDKLNGSILLVLPERMEYVGIPENLSKIRTAITRSVQP